MQASSDVTQLLRRWNEGEEQALDRLMPLIYDELKRLAHARVRHERPDHTLNTTALVHEAYLKLVDLDGVQWTDRAHFFTLSSRVMRHLLVNYAAQRKAQKRGVDQSGNSNTVQADPQDYFGRIGSFGHIGEAFVYDAGFVKLRELQLSYRLPSRLLASSPFKLVTLSLVGRNLWLIHSNIDNIDPESTFRNDQNGLGLETFGVPQTRSLGFNINVRL